MVMSATNYKTAIQKTACRFSGGSRGGKMREKKKKQEGRRERRRKANMMPVLCVPNPGLSLRATAIAAPFVLLFHSLADTKDFSLSVSDLSV